MKSAYQIADEILASVTQAIGMPDKVIRQTGMLTRVDENSTYFAVTAPTDDGSEIVMYSVTVTRI